MTKYSTTSDVTDGERSPDPSQSLLLIYDRLLGTRLYLHTWIRLLAVGTIISGSLFAKYIVGIKELNIPAFMGLAFVIALYNSIAWLISRKYRTPQRVFSAYRFLLNVMFATIALDYLCLTVSIWLVGGARSPFVTFYLLHVVISSILLSRRAAVQSTILAYVLLMLLAVAEWKHWITVPHPIGAIAGGEELDGRFVLTLMVVYGILFGLVAYLLVSLSRLVRRSEVKLRDTNDELGRLSQMRRDFLHIALHDLKSPVGAMASLLNNLKSGLCGDLNDKQEEWIDRCLKRLDGLTDFLDDLQLLASLEAGNLREHTEVIDIPNLLHEVVEENQDLAQPRGHFLGLEIEEGILPVSGVRRLLKEAVFNYVTNAIKFTLESGKIIVRARMAGDRISIEVTDTGIGIAEEDQPRLFNEFVRLRQTSSSSRTPGTGLGLSLVRRIVESHHGRTYVISATGQGSTFVIELPAHQGQEIKSDSD